MNALIALDHPSVASPLELTESETSSYRFLTNIASADMDRARQAARIAGPAGTFRLVPITCSDLGLPLQGAALYILNHLPEPETFWKLFHSLAPNRARRN